MTALCSGGVCSYVLSFIFKLPWESLHCYNSIILLQGIFLHIAYYYCLEYLGTLAFLHKFLIN